jgi:hypothetical protein
VFKRVFDISILKNYFLPLWNIKRYQFEIDQLKISKFLKLGGGAVLLLWANTFSPFGINRQKRILGMKYRPFEVLSPPLVIK